MSARKSALLAPLLLALGGAALVFHPDSSDTAGPRRGPGVRVGLRQVADERAAGLVALSTLELGPGAILDHAETPFELYLGGQGQHSGRARAWARDGVQLHADGRSAPTVLMGDALCGDPQRIELEKGAFITGRLEQQSAPEAWPALPTTPSGELDDHRWGAGLHEWTGTHVAGRVQLDGDAVLRLVGPAEITVRRLEAGAQTRLEVHAEKGAVRVHVLEGLQIAAGCTWSQSVQDAGSLLLQVGQGEVLPPEPPKILTDEERRTAELRRRLRGDQEEGKPIAVCRCALLRPASSLAGSMRRSRTWSFPRACASAAACARVA
ncbi:MAG: hypothetical protein R3F33_04700 [Planctomycetota bacterium]